MKGTPDDYVLGVRAGPNYKDLLPVKVNDEQNPLLIDSDHFVGYVVVRVAHFGGVTPDGTRPLVNPQSHYFYGRNRRYSIMVQGRFKKAWNGDDIIFGVDFDTKVRTPTGVGLAMRIAKWLDPSLDSCFSGNTPWIFSPWISAMNSLAVYSLDSPHVRNALPPIDTSAHAMAETGTPVPDSQVDDDSTVREPLASPPVGTNGSMHSVACVSSADADVQGKPAAGTPSLDIGQWSFQSRMISEDVSGLFIDTPKAPSLTSYEKRKKYFADARARKEVTIVPDRIYCMDYYDAYFDFNAMAIKLPGFSVNAFKYWDGQPLRFVCRNRDKSVVFFVVQFELLSRNSSDVTSRTSSVADYDVVRSVEALEDPVEVP
ncbi:hypothetical protein HDU85_000150 [Gaertneriomyces sp. JEL0708]|nr:hypothetical protein HDU85_000150 [Gaertneriomyces sp. JEL0708]